MKRDEELLANLTELCVNLTNNGCLPRYTNALNQAIDIVQKNRWTPVNEAMPPIDKGTSDIVLITYQYPNEKEKLAMAFYSIKHLNSLADGEWCTSYGYGLPATAWMPLPNAYKGEEEDE